MRKRKSLWSEVIRKIFIKPALEGEQDFSKMSGEDERMGITRVDEKARSKGTGTREGIWSRRTREGWRRALGLEFQF